MNAPSKQLTSLHALQATAPEQEATLSEVDLLSDESLRTKIAPDLFANPNTRHTLTTLRDLQRRHDEIFADYMRDKQALEDKYEKRFSPIFSMRERRLQEAPLPGFWSCAFDNCEVLRENITEKDAVALRYLTDVSCDTVTIGNRDTFSSDLALGSFILTFRFRENPFFENEQLTKTYVMEQNDFEDLAEARGCRILWKGTKDLTMRTMKKKGKNGRIVIKKQATDSFFNFFSPPQGVTDAHGELDATVIEELEDVMDADLELGECIRAEVIPRALLYFLDIAEGGDGGEEDDGDESKTNLSDGDVNTEGSLNDRPSTSEDECADTTCTKCCSNASPTEECKQQ